MKVTHQFGKKKIENFSSGNTGFLLTNKSGGYMCFYSNPVSKYNGVYFRTSKMFRVIECISLVDKTNVSELTNKFFLAERLKEGIKESFFLPHGLNSFVYELSKEHEADIFLDVKQAYDNRALGRFYEITEEEGMIIVKFTKKTDVKEDATHGEEEYSAYIAIKSSGMEYKKTEKWEQRKYTLDQKRNSLHEMFVYNSFRIKSKKIVFSFSEQKEKAIEEAKFVFENIEVLKKKQKGNYSRFADDNFALFCARSALDGLITNLEGGPGIYAGLPWFFQFWTRDEAISLKSAFLMKNRELAKRIFRRQVKNVREDGRIPNIVFERYSSITGDAPLASCDGVGWVFKRISDLLAIRKKEFSQEEIQLFTEQLELSIENLRKSYEVDLLIRNDDLESWMDTNAENGDDKRAGFRIEMQCLQLSMYKLAYQLTKKKEYKKIEEQMRAKVREKFWDKRILADGLEDFTIRPNIFIACYIYPELLSKEEWETCFENAIPRIWVEWGGLTTIDRSHPLFKNEHTGETPWSYHRGDVWFWVNNCAALVMHRINKEKFQPYIQKIVEASTEDILWKGTIGSHSELSSAKDQRAEGCLDQAWSSAMFIELMNELK